MEVLFHQFLDNRPVPLVVLFLELGNVGLVHECLEFGVILVGETLLLETIDGLLVDLARGKACLFGQQELGTLVDQVATLLLGFALVS